MTETDFVEIDESYIIHDVTTYVGYILFGFFHIVVLIVFINILIAMMSASYYHVLVIVALAIFSVVRTELAILSKLTLC